MPNKKYHRLVAPNADIKGARLYLNGDMFLEVRDLDSLDLTAAGLR